MNRFVSLLALVALVSCSPPAEQGKGPITPVKTEAPSGTYTLDKTHASLIFRVDHLGMSRYTARFKRLDAELVLDTAEPAKSQVNATVDATSLETDFPLPTPDFNAVLQNEQWLNTAAFPQIVFRSREVTLTGPNTAHILGDLTLHGVTKPVTLHATFNGGYAGMAMDPGGSRIGFSAHGTLKRSEFGVAYGIPAPGTTMGVGDDVEIFLETEFSRPVSGAPPPAATP